MSSLRFDPSGLAAPIATFSLAARDPATGDLGVAVASKFLAVGAVVPFLSAGVGAVATQAHANTTFGPRGLEMLSGGAAPQDCADAFRESDGGIARRQFGIVAADGGSATFTGVECHDWAGGRSGDGYAAQGNILAGPEVIDALVETFLARDGLAFPERMAAALLAADRAGGDRRGRQSAALIVVGQGKGYAGHNDRWIDLRVDDHNDPVPELQRLLELHRLYMNKPSVPPLELNAEKITWVQGVMREHGYLERPPSGAWDDETEAAFEALFGVENLEERWVAGPLVDPVAWQYLQDRFRAG